MSNQLFGDAAIVPHAIINDIPPADGLWRERELRESFAMSEDTLRDDNSHAATVRSDGPDRITIYHPIENGPMYQNAVGSVWLSRKQVAELLPILQEFVASSA